MHGALVLVFLSFPGFWARRWRCLYWPCTIATSDLRSSSRPQSKEYHRTLVGSIFYCLVTEAHTVWTAWPRSVPDGRNKLSTICWLQFKRINQLFHRTTWLRSPIIITSTKEVIFLPLCACFLSVCQQDNWEICWRILMIFYSGGIGMQLIRCWRWSGSRGRWGNF